MTETGQVVRDIVIKNRKEKSERDRATAFRKGLRFVHLFSSSDIG